MKGLAFDFGSGAPSAETKKYLTLLSGNKWFLPYRNMNNESPRTVYISESFMKRRIEVVFKTDSGVEKILKIILLHDLAESVIGDITPEQISKERKPYTGTRPTTSNNTIQIPPHSKLLANLIHRRFADVEQFA